jgi:isocitrate dehydrogenase
LAVSLEHLGTKYDNPKAIVLADALDEATEKYLENSKSPLRDAGEIDNRGSHFYLAMYWAEALSKQDKDADLKKIFTPIAKKLTENEAKINDELITAQGKSIDIGGYYEPTEKLVSEAMRPSKTFNNILSDLSAGAEIK